MKKIPVILALIAIAIVAYSMSNWSPERVIASKNITTETRSVNEFDKIDVAETFEIDVTYSNEEKVTVEAPENLQDLIQLKVRSGTLLIKFKNGHSISTNSAIKVHISTAKLNDFSLSGASSISLNNSLMDSKFNLECSGATSFKGKVEIVDAEIELSGASSVHLSGTAKAASLNLSGASQMNDYHFKVNNLSIDLSGASSVKVTSLNSLSGDVSGASSLNYKGNPSTKSISISGAANVHLR